MVLVEEKKGVAGARELFGTATLVLQRMRGTHDAHLLGVEVQQKESIFWSVDDWFLRFDSGGSCSLFGDCDGYCLHAYCNMEGAFFHIFRIEGAFLERELQLCSSLDAAGSAYEGAPLYLVNGRAL